MRETGGELAHFCRDCEHLAEHVWQHTRHFFTLFFFGNAGSLCRDHRCVAGYRSSERALVKRFALRQAVPAFTDGQGPPVSEL